MNGKNIIGVDLGGTNVRAGSIIENKIVKYSGMKISSMSEADVVLNEVINTIENVFTDDTQAIGIGVPSMVDIKNGIVFDVQNIPAWKEIHLKKIIEEIFNVPVFINNDANCFTLGAKHFGKGKEYSNIVGLIIGTGFGAGIIIDNKLYNGRNCGAGEFGMLPFRESIIEHYCCGQFFKKFYNISGEKLSNLAAEKNEKALAIFNEFGNSLGEAIKIILYTIDPDVIIIGGSVSKAFSYYQKSMFESINNFAYKEVLNNFKIEIEELEHVAIFGAASLYFNAQK